MSLRDSLAHDTVETLQVLDPVTVGPDQPISHAFDLMRARHVGCVIVTEHSKPIGIFTDRDVLTHVLEEKVRLDTPVVDVMTASPETVDEGSTVADVIRRMHHGGFRHMPTVSEGGLLRGVVSVKRIVAYLVEHFPSAVFNLPPDPGQEQLTREGA